MTTLAALVAMRLTHDLAGPLGAITAGLGLLDGGDPEIVALIADGATAAAASLRLHRFILAPPDDAMPARGLLAAWVATREGLTLDWIAAPRDAATAAMLLGLAMCAAEAAPAGGRLTVDDHGVTLVAATVRLDPGVVAAFGGAAVTAPRAALAGILAAVGTVMVAATPGGVRFDYQGSALPR